MLFLSSVLSQLSSHHLFEYQDLTLFMPFNLEHFILFDIQINVKSLYLLLLEFNYTFQNIINSYIFSIAPR